jgi:hypothetical protein
MSDEWGLRLAKAEGNIHIYPICERDIKQREIYINPPAKEEQDG